MIEFIQRLFESQDADTVNEIATRLWCPGSLRDEHGCPGDDSQYATVTFSRSEAGVHALVKVKAEDDSPRGWDLVKEININIIVS